MSLHTLAVWDAILSIGYLFLILGLALAGEDKPGSNPFAVLIGFATTIFTTWLILTILF